MTHDENTIKRCVRCELNYTIWANVDYGNDFRHSFDEVIVVYLYHQASHL